MKSKHFWWVRIFSVVLFVSLIFSGLGITPAWAAFTPSTFQAATLVLGQANFTSNGAATSQTGMYIPVAVAVDPVTQKVFVADSFNHRVLRFASVVSLANGAPAEAVLGQPNFTSNSPATAQNRMNLPCGVFVDSAGRLWVGDHNNNRVLRFDNASALANGANASAVLGQPNFTSNAAATSQTGMRGPYNLFVDSGGRLWVADDNNGRVLRFDNAASLANGAPASGVLGRPNFTNNTAGCSDTVMSARVTGVEVDSNGRLWVADHSGNRVLRFDNAAGLANGAAASGVLGQANFTTCTSATAANRMYGPVDVGMDPAGRLYAAEWSNNRVLIFENAASLANGANATYVLGQPDFTTGTVNTGGLSASSLYHPYSTFYDPLQNILWVADGFNNRVLRYGTLDTTPPTLQSFTRFDPATSPTSADTLVFRATFSEDVQNVDATDFTVNASPATTATITSVTQVSASLYEITVSGGDLAGYNGVIGLDLAAGQNITDLVGNPLPAGEPATDETYTVDNTFPTVLYGVNTIPANGSVLPTGPTQIGIEFNKDVLADGGANAANNVNNYLLVEAGADNLFNSVSCASPDLVGDTHITVNSAIYNNNGGAGPYLATLNINNAVPLPNGTYRLFVCGTTSVYDLAGNRLNNGADSTLTFTVSPAPAPDTGFAPGRFTVLPPQPADKAYAAMSDLWLEIPKLGVKMDIIGIPFSAGGWDVTWLGRKAGWLQGTTFPGWAGNSVLTAHVWNADNTPGPFVNLDWLWWGDRVIVHAWGQQYIYEVRSVQTIKPTKTSVMLKHEELPWLTLVTCRGYDETSDSYRYRVVVRAVQVEVR